VSPPRAGPEFLLHHPERESLMACLDLSSMGVGVQPMVSHRDLPLLRNMGSDPGDELQVVYPLDLSCVFPIPVADLAFPSIQGQAFQGKQRTNHVFSDTQDQAPEGLFRHQGRRAGRGPGLLHPNDALGSARKELQPLSRQP